MWACLHINIMIWRVKLSHELRENNAYWPLTLTLHCLLNGVYRTGQCIWDFKEVARGSFFPSPLNLCSGPSARDVWMLAWIVINSTVCTCKLQPTKNMQDWQTLKNVVFPGNSIVSPSPPWLVFVPNQFSVSGNCRCSFFLFTWHPITPSTDNHADQVNTFLKCIFWQFHACIYYILVICSLLPSPIPLPLLLNPIFFPTSSSSISVWFCFVFIVVKLVLHSGAWVRSHSLEHKQLNSI